ncbi:amidohydrolase [Ferruginibacter lapsinanis]|uniref:amidohydrolase n=1 Tax=Ferruginibacter lapsinanis TaxID=563172 RepID=UPI001E2BA79C|nr:amidohydrolase [Ferruginibacter lapsinanis]UEG50831.1 amidohydrolase [Ferruginibacter lapsinanis]
MSSLAVTTIQTNLYWQDKVSNLQMLEQKINSISDKTNIVVLPEMFTTGFSMQPELFAETMEGSTIEWMKMVSRKKNSILTGSLIIKEGEQFFNRLIWMLPNGQYGQYDKRHLFAFGKEDNHYTAGNKRLIASVNGWKINLQVCYDLRFPVWGRQQSEAEYDVLIYVANWPNIRSHAWKSLLIARAIENQCYVIGVNRVGNDGNDIYHSGDSMIIDPLGETIYHKADEEDIFTALLQKEKLEQVRNKFPFGKDADSFKLL